MKRALNSDFLYTAKVGINLNKVYDFETLSNNLTMRVSQEISSNFTDTSFLKTKFFIRYLFPIVEDKIVLHSALTTGFIKNLK